MAVNHGEKSYLVLGAETTWGTTPGTPVYYHVPVNAYGVVMKRDRRNAASFTGLRQRKHGKSYRGMPAGAISTNLHGYIPTGGAVSLAQYLIDWAFGQPEVVDLDSKFADWAEGPNVSNVRHNGLRVNTVALEGSADSGLITLNLDLMGKTEAALATAQTLPNDREKLVEFEFTDATFAIGGAAVSLRSFKYNLSNSLTATYLNATSPSHISAGSRVESLMFQLMKDADTYAAINRAFAESEFTGQIVLKGLHNGTGTGGTNYTVLTIDFARLAFVNNDDQRTLAALMESALNFDILKPDTSGDAVTFTWSEAA